VLRRSTLLGIAFVAAVLADAPTLVAGSSGPSASDIGIIRLLRPQDDTTVIIAEHDGSAHVITADEVADILHPVATDTPLPATPRPSTPPPSPTANPTPTRAAATPAPRPTATPTPRLTATSTPRPTATPTPRPTATPTPRPTATPTPRPTLTRRPTVTPTSTSTATPRPVVARIDISEDTRGFVPTYDVPKPAVHPTPTVVNRHSLLWQYQHRFDTVPPDEAEDLLIPGIPVRAQVDSPFDIRTGAFHGVRSLNGYSAERVRVSIPCGVRHFVTGNGYNEVARGNGTVDLETGYVYIGGWGAGDAGTAVDAGLQKSSSQAVDDEYAFYFKFGHNQPITAARFPCDGPDVTMTFYPLTDSLLVFSATGVLEHNEHAHIVLVQKTEPADGWSRDGGSAQNGVILKRLVSIAQPDTWRFSRTAQSLERFSSGSYFGIENPSDRVPRIVWKTCEVGHVTPDGRAVFHPWDRANTWTPRQPGTYVNWPPADVIERPGSFCDAAAISLRHAAD